MADSKKDAVLFISKPVTARLRYPGSGTSTRAGPQPVEATDRLQELRDGVRLGGSEVSEV